MLPRALALAQTEASHEAQDALVNRVAIDLLLFHRATVFDTKPLIQYVAGSSLCDLEIATQNKTRFPQLLLACSLQLRRPLAFSWAALYHL